MQHVAIKLSGACTLCREPFPYRDIWDPVCRVIDAFGIDRCMWGTDWTRAVKFLNYAQGVDAFRVTDRISQSDTAKLMGGTLARIYGWSPQSEASSNQTSVAADEGIELLRCSPSPPSRDRSRRASRLPVETASILLADQGGAPMQT